MAQFTIQYGRDGGSAAPDGRLDAPPFHRNHEPIWSVLGPHLVGRAGHVLELGSGTGQHAVAYAGRTPDIVWWPSDTNPAHLASIEAWRRYSRLGNVRPPLAIDLAEPGWRVEAEEVREAGGFLALFCANVLHIAPWRVAEGLIDGAGRQLGPDGRLFVYGPFMRDGAHTAPSNAAFDASLRRQNPEWGVRDMADLDRLAAVADLRLAEAVDMPSNNFVLVFERSRQRPRAGG
jgi:SAM-dependent methyltransferase